MALAIGGLAVIALLTVAPLAGWFERGDAVSDVKGAWAFLGGLFSALYGLQISARRVLLDDRGASFVVALFGLRFCWRFFAWSSASRVSASVQSGTLVSINLASGMRIVKIEVLHHDGEAVARYVAARTPASAWEGFFPQIVSRAA